MVAGARPRIEQGEARWLLTLSGVLFALLGLRVVALAANATDLFFDEAQYWSWSLEPAFGYYSKPPLIAWVIRVATGLCGPSEFCVRLPSPVIHTATALVIYAIAARLYDARTGFWSAVAFATLPGISLSAGIISTDVPLLFFWALALLAFVHLVQEKSWWPAVLLGAALGLGANAKYAMAYFILSAGLYILAEPRRRDLARDPRVYAALALALLLIAPNLAWNASNSFATFSHTADNAKWSGALFNPGKALEFLGAQFGVFGPILFGALAVISVRALRQGLPDPDRLLLTFALPVLGIVTAQAFVSRAHANWAAVSYVSATILVIATLLRDLSWRWMRASFAINLSILVLLALAVAGAGRFRLPLAGDPFSRTLGWRALAEETAAILAESRRAGAPFGAVMTEDRAVTAELLYYMRHDPTPVLAWMERGRPRDHYELTRPYRKGSPEPVLLVSLRPGVGSAGRLFATAVPIAERDVPAGARTSRRVTFFRLEGYKGD
jgi:4-amino-4-deoxy-L-arabinose transferase-like glycosyltransferase